jgi:serine/threonine protein kinase
MMLMLLVLYSVAENAWKIADFGLTVQGTSKKKYTTKYARGTASYRAPELIKEDGKFNNKVDVWAVGCILFEVIFGRKAFANDNAIQNYAANNVFFGTPFKLPETTVIALDLDSIAPIVLSTLANVPSNRPSAKELIARFDTAFVYVENRNQPTHFLDVLHRTIVVDEAAEQDDADYTDATQISKGSSGF